MKTTFELTSLSNSLFPIPIAAGIFNSRHLIAICELEPPYFVTKPFIFFVKMKSKPGSALSINIILFSILLMLLKLFKYLIFPSIFLFVI